MKQSLFVLVALAICVFAADEAQDQEAAEQYFLRYGLIFIHSFQINFLGFKNYLIVLIWSYYPSWYSGYYGAGIRSVGAYPYAYGAYGLRSGFYGGLYNRAVVY